jgi:hypothetical protein
LDANGKVLYTCPDVLAMRRRAAVTVLGSRNSRGGASSELSTAERATLAGVTEGVRS